MSLTDMLGGLLQQYAGGGAVSNEEAHGHYDQVASQVDSSSLSSAIGAMMRSDQTPAFGQIAAQMFGSGDASQKATMLNALLAGGGPAVMSQLAGLIPGLGGSQVTPEQAQNVSAEAVAQAAAQAEKHDPSILDRMSSVYANHPTLVKTLGTGAMIIAMRELAKRVAPRA
ncbi:MAG: hypothetical protein U0Q16_09755 [Bryobacteraceae bacterium]